LLSRYSRRTGKEKSISTMKKILEITWVVLAVSLLAGCNDVKRNPGRVYMPDMAYSRAYETYSVTQQDRDALAKQGIHFSNKPVPGTIKRGELFPFLLAKDKIGDTSNYVASKQVHNPLPVPDAAGMEEAERLYLVNCGICHGQQLDGNGPLYRGGEGPFAAKPANLASDAKYIAMPEGQMFYSVTYGKNKMGSYASQLDARQRWNVIHFIKSKQAAATKASEPAATDSAAAKK
jgi:mono/diheme cytochrome c family protein